MARRNRLSLESLETRTLMAVDAFLPELDLSSGQESSLIGLLVPAEVREADAAMDAELPADELPIDSDDEADPIGMLLPAIQKVRDAANRSSSSYDLLPTDELPLANEEEGGENALIGLLVPAVREEEADYEGSHALYQDVFIPANSTGEEAQGAGGGAGKVSYSDLNVMISSTDLDLAFVNDDAEAYLTIKMKDVLISSYKI